MQLSEIEEFLDSYRRVSFASNREKMHAIAQLLDDFAPLHERVAEWRRQTASRFNVFEALGLERRELTHSKLIAYLLDPRARHDQGDRPLKIFLEHFSVPVSATANLGRTQVVCEFPLNELGRLDIVVFLSDGSIIGIENKVDAGEQESQVSRYQQWLSRHERLSKRRNVLVFLTPDGREPEAVISGIDVVCCSYARLAQWLGSLEDLPPRLATIVSMYAEICTWIGRSHD